MIKFNIIFKLFMCCYILLPSEAAFLYSEKRIVGGVPTTIESAPYLVQILSDGSIICGGTLVSERFVVTAAHCFENKPKRLSVKGGATKLTETGVISKIRKLIIPTAYNSSSYDMDVAVIKLVKPLTGPLIKPIALCEGGWKTGDPVKLFGWGKKSDDADSIPINLHTTTVNVVNTPMCKNLYYFRQPLTDSMFCAAASGKDACGGDSGGPAIVNGKYCGIVSWGIGCAWTLAPGVFTNVNKVRQFILNAMEK